MVRMLIIQIALGIVAAIFILALLPLILEGLGKLITEVILPIIVVIAVIALILILYHFSNLLLESSEYRKPTFIAVMIIFIYMLAVKLHKDKRNNLNRKLSMKRMFICVLPTFGLSIKKINILKSIDEQQLAYQGSERADVFEKWFKLLVKYEEEFGNSSVPKEFKYDGVYLGAWLADKVTGRLALLCDDNPESFLRYWTGLRPTLEQINRLDELGVIWGPAFTQWDKMFEKLVEYKKSYGDCTGYADTNIHKWVLKQNTQKPARTTKEINRLNELGFDWDVLGTQWEREFKRLVAYQQEFGDCLVPKPDGFQSGSDYNLYEWVIMQRIYKSKLTVEQVRRLDDLGFW